MTGISFCGNRVLRKIIGGSYFSETRLLRGIAVGFEASPGEDISDAVYELIKAVDDPRETLRLIEAELDADPLYGDGREC